MVGKSAYSIEEDSVATLARASLSGYNALALYPTAFWHPIKFRK